ncbi:MAG: Protein translocase subunit SecF, partial [uncultured Thermoleophilia bacterium]
MSRRGNLITIVLVLGMLAAAVGVSLTRDVVLGLDLRGGAEATFQAQPTDEGTEVTPELVQQAIGVLRDRIDSVGAREPEIRREGEDRIGVALAGVDNPEEVLEVVGSTGQLYFIDLEQGLTPGVSRSVVAGGSISPKDSLRQLLEATKDTATGATDFYAFEKGKAAPVINTSGPQASLRNDPAVAAVPPARLEFLPVPKGKLPASCSGDSPAGCPGLGAPEPGKTYWYMFDLPPEDQRLTGRDLDDARPDVDPQSGRSVVTMDFSDRGGRLFEDITRRLAQDGRTEFNQAVAAGQAGEGLEEQFFHHFAVVLDGDIKTFPTIDFTRNGEGISGGRAEITGVQGDEARDIATVLQSGSLPVELIPLSVNQVSATLGAESLDQGLLAGGLGLLVVMIYLLVFYRFLGLIADIALLIYAVLFYGIIVAIPVTMTLPGIAGMILTIGVAADANVVVFERIKEEVRAGRTVRAAIGSGYTKGFSTILDANAVTLITAAVLFVASQASVKGFALLLALGVIVSMITAVAATRALLGILGNFRWFNNAAFMGATASPVRWKADYAGRRTLWFAISGVIIAIGIGSLATKGLNEGIDFAGGTRVEFTTGDQRLTTEQVRTAIAGSAPGIAEAVVRGVNEEGDSGDRYARFQLDSEELSNTELQRVEAELVRDFGAGIDFEEARSVSASFGSEILRDAVLAFIFSMVLIIAYVSLRFDWKYAAPMIVALLHDLLITVGVYSLTGREVSSATVAAVLTILGYSLYDTVIIFDRVRENERGLRRHTYDQIVNISLWETITRSLNTSFITLLPILSLYLFGGETLRDFAFALLVGIFSGAYSSIFIAAPLLAYLKGREPEYRRRPGSTELPYVFLRPEGSTVGTPEPVLAGVGADGPDAGEAAAPQRGRLRRLGAAN